MDEQLNTYGTKPGAPLAPLKLPLGRVPSLPRNFLFFRSSCFFPKPFSFATYQTKKLKQNQQTLITLLYCSTIFMASSLSSSTKVISTKVGTATSLSSSGRAKLAVDGQRLFTAPNKNRVSLRPGRITRYLRKFHSLKKEAEVFPPWPESGPIRKLHISYTIFSQPPQHYTGHCFR